MATTTVAPLIEAWSLSERGCNALGTAWRQVSMPDPVQVAEMTSPSEPMDTSISAAISIYDFIFELPDVNYILRQPIPVHLTQEDDGEWTARFEAANIGISDKDQEGAKDSLVYDILDTMDFLSKHEGALIPNLKRSLAVLRHYIEVCKP